MAMKIKMGRYEASMGEGRSVCKIPTDKPTGKKA